MRGAAPVEADRDSVVPQELLPQVWKRLISIKCESRRRPSEWDWHPSFELPLSGDIGAFPRPIRRDEGFGWPLSRFSASLALALAGGAFATGNPEIAALQVGLRAAACTPERSTASSAPAPEAVRRFQHRAGLTGDGVPGKSTRKALGVTAASTARPPCASAGTGAGTWPHAVRARLARLPSGRIDGDLGSHTDAALGVVSAPGGDRRRMGSLDRPHLPPCASPRPLPAPDGSPADRALSATPSVPAGTGSTPGLDFPAPKGAAVGAARSGRIVSAGWGGNGSGISRDRPRQRRAHFLRPPSSDVRGSPGKSVSTGPTSATSAPQESPPARTFTLK